MQPETPATIVATVPKNKTETVVVALDEFRGTKLVHVRQHYRDDAGEDRATIKGACLSIDRLPELRAAIEAAEREAVARGWLPSPDGAS